MSRDRKKSFEFSQMTFQTLFSCSSLPKFAFRSICMANHFENHYNLQNDKTMRFLLLLSVKVFPSFTHSYSMRERERAKCIPNRALKNIKCIKWRGRGKCKKWVRESSEHINMIITISFNLLSLSFPLNEWMQVDHHLITGYKSEEERKELHPDHQLLWSERTESAKNNNKNLCGTKLITRKKKCILQKDKMM